MIDVIIDDTLNIEGIEKCAPYVAGIANRLLEIHRSRDIAEPIVIGFSSEGGVVSGGQVIMGVISALRRAGRRVHGHVLGYAWSQAFEILQFCDHRSIEDYGTLMMHEAQATLDGSTSARKSEAEFEERAGTIIHAIIAKRTGRPVSYYRGKTRNSDWYMTAAEALAENLVDEIIPTPAFATPPPLPEAPKRRRSRNRSGGLEAAVA